MGDMKKIDYKDESNIEKIEELDDFPEEKISDAQYDEVYSTLKDEILNNNSNSTSQLEKTLNQVCRVCGKPSYSGENGPRCKLCGVIICRKCTSCGFCLNCYVHLVEDARKTLKLTRILAITIPGLFLFLNIYGFLYYLIVTLSSIAMFIGLHYYTRTSIVKNISKYVDPKWVQIIKSDYYQKLKDSKYNKRYISEDEVKKKEDIKIERVEDLKEWIGLDYSEDRLPKKSPIYEENTEENSKPEENQISFENLLVNEDVEVIYTLVGKPCPICKSKIEFADFCHECNVRFCPSCGEETSPYSKRCLCGNILVDLEIEFAKYLRKINKT